MTLEPVVTPELMLQAIGFSVDDLRHALTRDREALDAVLPSKVRRKSVELKGNGDVLPAEEVTIEEGGAPDWDTRQRSIEHMYDLAGIRKRTSEDSGQGKPINVVINLSAQPASPLPGVKVITSDNQ